jgi:hypothetical protein
MPRFPPTNHRIFCCVSVSAHNKPHRQSSTPTQAPPSIAAEHYLVADVQNIYPLRGVPQAGDVRMYESKALHISLLFFRRNPSIGILEQILTPDTTPSSVGSDTHPPLSKIQNDVRRRSARLIRCLIHAHYPIPSPIS